MPIDKTKYHDLERLFRAQVEKDKGHAIEQVVKGWGVYLPCEEPESQVDYIFVGMEPSFAWADSIEHAEQKIAKGFRNFGIPADYRDTLTKDNLILFRLAIKHFLCKPGEKTYHLTDVSKGAMPITVAALDRERRYEEWYPLLLEEIAIVGKPGAPVIAIGKKVEKFLQRKDLKGNTGRSLCSVPHYSLQAARHFKEEAEKDREGFELFKKAEFSEGSRWATDLSLAKKQLVFTYMKRFKMIQEIEGDGRGFGVHW